MLLTGCLCRIICGSAGMSCFIFTRGDDWARSLAPPPLAHLPPLGFWKMVVLGS